MKKSYRLSGLDCANCAAKIEQAVQKMPEVEVANVDFMQKKLTVTANPVKESRFEKALKQTVTTVEEEVTVSDFESGGHDHDHAGHNNTMLWRIIISLVAFFVLIMLKPADIFGFISYLAVYLLIGGDIVYKALRNLRGGRIFDENFLMGLATVGAFLIGEYPEAIAVMLFFQVGEYLQDYAVNQSRRNVQALLAVRPDQARLVTPTGEQLVTPEQVAIGDTVVVLPGEKIPLDGKIQVGQSHIDTAALTGESMPQSVGIGDEVLSGCINKDGRLEIIVTKKFADASVNKILELVENASSQKAPAEKFITKFARYYTPVVVLFAVLLFFIPVLFFQGTPNEWLYRALTFLVISCPCALVISVPLSFFGGIGGASKAGILVKGSNYLELLAQVDTVVFDKTGTLTEGQFAIDQIVTTGTVNEEQLLTIAASVEQHSNHPIAQSIVAATAGTTLLSAEDVKEVAGHGLEARVDGQFVQVGNAKLMKEVTNELPAVDAVGTVVYVAIEQQYVGYFVVADQIKPDSLSAIQQLKKLGVKDVVMLTGDNARVAESVGKKLAVDVVRSELLPEGKVAELENLQSNADRTIAFVGDGINDAPVLTMADVGVAMGGLGSDAAIEAADVVLMNDQPSKLVTSIRLARKTLRIVKQNIAFALGVKFLVLILGAIGYASMGMAVFADVGVTLLAVLNAMRCLQVKE